MSVNQEDINSALKVLVAIRTESAGNPTYGFDDTFDNFITKLLFLTPQSYGARLQAFLIKRFGLMAQTSKDAGDFVDQFGQPHELKASIITPTNSGLNLVQIRPWQDVDYYCVAIDTTCSPYQEYVFVLSKSQMLKELEINGATPAHGTSLANEKNTNIELRMAVTIRAGDVVFERWKTQYLRTKIRLSKNAEAF